LAAEVSGSYLIIPYDSWVTQLRVSGGFSLGAFMGLQLRYAEETR
jgi:hypothetical protein